MLRFKALEIASARQPLPANTPTGKISEYFGMLTFNDSAMREYLTAEAYRQVIAAIEEGEKIDRRIADQIAASMRA